MVHDCADAESNVTVGVLPSGTPLVIDRLAAETELLIAEGFIEPHFFAGFSGGRKSCLLYTSVAVALEAMNAGDSVIINGEGPEVKIVQSLPQGHKFAVRPIKCGETVVKYGHSIGTACLLYTSRCV